MSDFEDYTDEELDAMYEAARKETLMGKARELSDATRGCLTVVFTPILDWLAFSLSPAVTYGLNPRHWVFWIMLIVMFVLWRSGAF